MPAARARDSGYAFEGADFELGGGVKASRLIVEIGVPGSPIIDT